jgi:hypothetical protein
MSDKTNPFDEPAQWSRITFGGVEIPVMKVEVADMPRSQLVRPVCRIVGRIYCSVTFKVTREDYTRMMAVLRPAMRRHYVRRHLMARTMAKCRVRS